MGSLDLCSALERSTGQQPLSFSAIEPIDETLNICASHQLHKAARLQHYIHNRILDPFGNAPIKQYLRWCCTRTLRLLHTCNVPLFHIKISYANHLESCMTHDWGFFFWKLNKIQTHVAYSTAKPLQRFFVPWNVISLLYVPFQCQEWPNECDQMRRGIVLLVLPPQRGEIVRTLSYADNSIWPIGVSIKI